ncbi:MAG TPA: aldo/keto reductase, partial [Enterovirga sp.]|nr:aldo/keto reductase [Enterovirga sp.]
MKMRELGRSGIQVPPLCFGGNVFGWTADEKRSFELLDALAEAGLTFIDTANVYSAWVPGHQGGESEAIIGRWLKARGGRDRLIIATKVGMRMGDGREGLRPDYIRVAVEESLARLQTDYIDLYQSHRDDGSTP